MSEDDVYAQVLYDFCYINDGIEIKMKEGEELLVVRKSNQNWWQVIRSSEHQPFYAPTCCLSIVPNLQDIDFLKNNSNSKDVNANFDSSLIKEDVITSQFNLISSNIIINDESKTHDIAHEEQLLNSVSPKASLCFENNLIILKEVTANTASSDSVVESNHVQENERKITKEDSFLNEDLPPKPGPDDIPHRSLPNDWFEFLDNNGRKYYHHSTSGKVTWKPPRRSETLPNSCMKKNPFTENAPVPTPPPKQLKPKLQKLAHSSTESLDLPTSLCKFTILPPGWNQECDLDSGIVYYHNELSKKKEIKLQRFGFLCTNMEMVDNIESEDDSSYGTPDTTWVNVNHDVQWYSSQDENGRIYFYDEDSSESFWELPNYSSPDAEEFVTADASHASYEISLDALSSALPSVSKSEYFTCEDGSPKLHLKRAPKLPVPRQFKTRSMVVPDSVSITSSEKEKNSQYLLGCVLIEGTLNKTKLVENGRRVRKNWTTSYIVLTDVSLLFYKDNRSVHPITNSKPEFSIDLNGALVDWCPEKSSRKNVFQDIYSFDHHDHEYDTQFVRELGPNPARTNIGLFYIGESGLKISTILGHQLLLQHDDVQEIKDWFWAIQDAIVKLPYSLENAGTKQDNDDNCKNSIKLSRSKSTKPCHCHKDSDEGINISIPAEKKLKIRDKLRQFFVRRPTMESLREQGIILDEPVFGCHLENLCQGEQHVPKFVIKCIQIIENKELTADGLYRASGNLSQVQKIRFHVNQDDYKCLEEEEDVHVLTGALKMFFREMKEPLFPFQMFNKFLQAIALPDAQSKMKILKDLIHKMPDSNFHTLRFLLQHLLKVTEFHKENRMQVQNLAIVFGPTLMWPEEESANIALDMMHQNRIIEFLLLEFKSIFE